MNKMNKLHERHKPPKFTQEEIDTIIFVYLSERLKLELKDFYKGKFICKLFVNVGKK